MRSNASPTSRWACAAVKRSPTTVPFIRSRNIVRESPANSASTEMIAGTPILPTPYFPPGECKCWPVLSRESMCRRDYLANYPRDTNRASHAQNCASRLGRAVAPKDFWYGIAQSCFESMRPFACTLKFPASEPACHDRADAASFVGKKRLITELSSAWSNSVTFLKT
jgi:hypothetical protein